MYRIFDTTLSSDFALPELPTVEQGEPAFSVGLASDGGWRQDGFERVFDWPGESGAAVCWCERRRDEYLFVFPELARFLVTPDDRVLCQPDACCEPSLLRHLLINQVLPRYLGTRGRLVVHASAVMLPNGRSVAFLGEAGFGKSTLASSFHRHGARLVSDDCLLLGFDGDGMTAIGGLQGIRLFPDSLAAVFGGSAGFAPYTEYSDKRQLILSSDAAADAPRPCRLNALCLLNDPVQAPAGEVELVPASGSELMIAMIRCLFSLDPSDRGTMTQHFQDVGRAAGPGLQAFHLHYPRSHGRLAEVRAVITSRLC